MTKKIGQDFDFDNPSHSGQLKPESRAGRIIAKLFDFLLPAAIALLAVYIGRYGLDI